MNVTDYIHTNIDRSIQKDQSGSGFQGIDLPYPYTSPCIKGEGKFHFFFYWDTYFTNLALLATDRQHIAKQNIQNILWLIQRQGYMPNHIGIDNRSQPPYLCRMVTDYFQHIGGPQTDPHFFQQCAQSLLTEYNWWITARHTPTGLQRHSQHDTQQGCIDFYNIKRVLAQGNPPDASDQHKHHIGGHFLAEAETGWDFNQRFHARCSDHNPPDLNSLLHDYEQFFIQHSHHLNWNQTIDWQQRAAQRRQKTTDLLWDQKRGWFFDYDYINQKQSPVYALSGLLPLLTGLATPQQAQAIRDNLHLLERDHGIAVTNQRPNCRNYQWAYPNVWPPLIYTTVQSLHRYGHTQDAQRIAQKYIDTTDTLFQKTGQLWEKTDAETGQVARGEYDAAPMIGWTAGVYLALKNQQNNTQ